MAAAALRRASLPDQVFRELVGSVLSGSYAPGDRLPAQRALAAELGVNMASLREGIKRLEQLRLLDVRHGDAMRVLDWRQHAGLDVLVHAAAADPDLVRSLFEARGLLLREAARLAAGRRSDAGSELLLSLADRIADAPDERTAQGLDLAFFRTVIEESGNLVFRLILNSIGELYVERLELFAPIVADRDELGPLYRRAARAIAAGAPGRAAAAVARLAALQEARMVERPEAP
jgi:GntR family transcriptional regulator, transcriptional repressor for pyruvate dehydrogenase complex